MERTGLEITVLGAGVAGLTTALVLAQRGFAVTVLERAEAVSEVGAGLQISPNGVRVLVALGLGAEFDAATMLSKAVVLRDGLSGAECLRMALPASPGFHLTHRADLIDLLAQASRAAGVRIQLLQHVKRVEIGDDGAPVLHMMTGARHYADVVIGADGLHAPSRSAVVGGQGAPQFTGQVAWRAVVPGGIRAAAEATVFMGPGRHVVSYPLRDGTLRNIVAVEERQVWAEDGWNHPDDPARMRRAFAGFTPEVRGWLSEARNVFLWGLFRYPVPERFHRGRVVLVGDAVHPTLPFLAQGANMALEDAWVLGQALDEAGTVEDAFARYQSERQARVRRIVQAASRNATAYHLKPGPVRTLAHTGLSLVNRVAPDLMLKRFDWLYGLDVTQTGQASSSTQTGT